jgi:2-methylisocitrate lyase-like PEP mutase family enzyme
MASQSEKAVVLRSLHTGGRLLLLPNIWDPIGARVLEAKGYPAAATASAAVSASLGFLDGQNMRRETLVECLRRIAQSVDIPVTADIEAGYGGTPAELRESAERFLETGIAGINLEDSIIEGNSLRPIEEQCQRIAIFREAGARQDVHLVINARVDAFLSADYPEKAQALEEAAVRAKRYVEAGADCIYPIGPGDEATARALRARIRAPINILASPAAAPLPVLEKIGINRVSFGPFVFRSCLARFVEIVEQLPAAADYSVLGMPLGSADVRPFLRAGAE